MTDWDLRSVQQRLVAYFQRQGTDVPRIASEILISHALKMRRIEIYADFERPVGQEEVDALGEMAKRHARGEPLAFIVGQVSFFSFDFAIRKGIFCPRPETEDLVERAAVRLNGRKGEVLKMIDLCCGSGVIGLSLARLFEGAAVDLADIDEEAVRLTNENAERLGVRERTNIAHSDLFGAFGDQRYDAILSNPPYIPTGDLPALEKAVRDFDPPRSLDGGGDGLNFYRRIVEQAAPRLLPGGFLGLELGIGQRESVEELMRRAGFSEIECHPDLSGIDRTIFASRKE